MGTHNQYHASEHVDGTTDDIQNATNAQKGLATAEQITKLDGIETLADVTDATNVASAGATMDADTSLVGNGYFLDDDTMLADDPTKVASQQSIKAYVDGVVQGSIILQGDWNAETNTPDISSEETAGHAWRVSVAGTTNLGGITDWQVGDLAVKTQDPSVFSSSSSSSETPSGWIKIDNTDIEAVWGNITGTLSNQTDLQNALDDKQDILAEGAFIDGDKTKLDGIEALADVTDATNVNAVESDPIVGAVTGIVKADGAGNISAAVEDTDYQGVLAEGAFVDGDKTKLDGIEALADVTDATNVAAAGATMDADTSLVGNGYFLDDDTLSADDDTKVASQQSVKAYVDSSVGAGASIQLTWKFSTTTTASDPGSKTFRYDNATPASVTNLYVSDISESGADVSTILANISVGDRLYIQQNSTAADFLLVSISSIPTDNTGWWTLPVTVLDSGALPTNNQKCGWIIFYTTPDLHAATHENGNTDEINVAGLSGELADAQPPKTHAASHIDGTDDIQSATNSVKGLATAEQITDLEANTALRKTDVAQVTHGFAVGDTIYNAAGTWTKSQANNQNTLTVGIVSESDVVTTNTNFSVVLIGPVTITTHGYTLGSYLFTSEITSGLLTETEPTGLTEYSDPVAFVMDANTIFVLPWRPQNAIPRSNDLKLVSINDTDSPYTVLDTDEFVIVDATSGAVIVNLPTPSSDYDGFTVKVKKFDSSVNTVTVKSASGNIDDAVGTTGQVLSLQNEAITPSCNTVDYFLG